MGVEPPFIYDHPSRYSFDGPTDRAFNPKAATQASWSPPASKPKQDGPLVNFNKHPDSVRTSRLHCASPTNAIAVPDCAVWQPERQTDEPKHAYQDQVLETGAAGTACSGTVWSTRPSLLRDRHQGNVRLARMDNSNSTMCGLGAHSLCSIPFVPVRNRQNCRIQCKLHALRRHD